MHTNWGRRRRTAPNASRRLPGALAPRAHALARGGRIEVAPVPARKTAGRGEAEKLGNLGKGPVLVGDVAAPEPPAPGFPHLPEPGAPPPRGAGPRAPRHAPPGRPRGA